MAKKILIIDDEQEILKVLIARLTVHGFEAVSANDGESGFEKARKFLPDVILLDVVMPGWSGLETANKLKSNPGTADTPIIFLTGLGDDSMTRKYLEYGNCRVLLKPFNMNELLAILARDFGM
jgi:DNA-binding response OmpR family regulator